LYYKVQDITTVAISITYNESIISDDQGNLTRTVTMESSSMTVPIRKASLDNEYVLDTEECRVSKPTLDQNRITPIETDDNDEVVPASPEDFSKDYVLVVPKKLTKYAQNILFARKALPMSWNLEGRFGSRTFRVDNARMGVPVLEKKLFRELAQRFPDLQELIELPEVQLRYQTFVQAPQHRIKELPYIDARHRPERAPPDFDLDFAMAEAAKLKLDNSPQRKPVFTYAELFAGMGGFGVALDVLGGRCVFCSELEKHLREIYHHNFVVVPNRTRPASDHIDIPIYGDIHQVPDSAFPQSLDLLVGGFPCQPFSALGEQPGFDCPKSGNLFLEIVRCLKVSKPKAFLLENVPGLLTMTETYNTIVQALEEVGYNVQTEVIAARGLTATGRKRLFFVGLRRDTEQPQNADDGTATDNRQQEYQFPFIPDLQLKARDVIDYDEVPTEEMELLRLSDETFQQLLNCGRWRTHSLAWPNKTLDTMTSHYGKYDTETESPIDCWVNR
jgi:DNA-cytosine methyltransferase